MTSPVMTAGRNGSTHLGDAGLYDRAREAVRFYTDAGWVGEHFDHDRRRAGKHLERQFVPELADTSLDLEELSRVLTRFPDRDDWERSGHDPEALVAELDREEQERRAAEWRRCESDQHRAQRKSCRALLEKTLQIRCLRDLRDGEWRPVFRTLGGLDELIPDATAREWFALTGGPADDSPGEQAVEGRRRLRRKVLARLKRRGLVAFRTDAEEEEVRCTPRPATGFALDEELEDFLPRSADEVFGLEEQLLRDGCQDALIVWRQENVLVDGYTRLRFLSLIGAPYRVERMDFPNRQAVRDWLWARHFGRRQFSELIKAYFIGREYNRRKQKHGGSRKGSSAPCAHLNGTAEIVGKEYDLDPATVRRYGAFAEALDRVAEVCGDEVRGWMLSREVSWTQRDIRLLAALDPEEMGRKVDQALDQGVRPEFPKVERTKLWARLRLDDPEAFLAGLRACVDGAGFEALRRAMNAAMPR